MKDRIQWVDHMGCQILSADYSRLSEQDYIQTMEEVKDELDKLPPDQAVYIMANVTGTKPSMKVRDKGKQVSEAMNRFKGQANAVVGITGVMKVLAKTFTSGMYYAKDEDDAKDWLVAESKKI